MSIGTQLRQARETKALSLDQVAQATCIKLRYLEALEADKFDVLSSAAQLHGFIRAYADYLKLDSNELLGTLNKDLPISPAQARPAPASGDTKPSLMSSEAIFKDLGHTLKSQRELMSLSLGDVERHTHIRLHYVRALEEGDITHLPSPVQGRGMLSNYASFLGLDTEKVLLRFADGLQASLYDRQAARNTSPSSLQSKHAGQASPKPSQLRRLFSMDLFVGGFLILFLLGFTIWGALRISRLHSGQQASPTAPPVSEILLSTPLENTTGLLTPVASIEFTSVSTAFLEAPIITGTVQVAGPVTPVAVEPSPGAENAPVQVYVIAVQRAWMRIIVDGEIAFEGRVMPGSAYSFAGIDRIELLTGNGAGLQVYFNQQDLGLLGGFGEVVERIFSIEGLQTATPAVRPTRTVAPTPQATPTPSPTRTFVPGTPTSTPKP